MSQQTDAFDAQQEALQDVAARSERPTTRHEHAMRTYLAGFGYAESRPRPATRVDEPQPVDEPAPQVRRRAARRRSA